MKKVICWILILICLAVFCFSGYKLLSTLWAYKEARSFYDDTADSFVSAPSEDAAPEKVVPADGGPAVYVQEDGQETAPIEVDFEALQAQCGDVIGWLYCEDTVINYPIVQSSDNSYYLHRMLDGSYSANGTVFMDYLCMPDFSGGNSILYGHNMRDGSMFHSLLEYGKQDYYDEHPVLYLLTPEQNYTVRLFAGLTAPADGWPYVVEFASDAEKAEYLQTAVDASNFRALVTPSAEDRILTLSTCSYTYDNARYLVMGILTPIA